MITRRGTERRARHAAVVVVLALVGGCNNGEDEPVADPSVLHDDLISIGSFDFPESQTLAYVYGGALEAGGFSIDVRQTVGPRELIMPALVKGLIEVIPEYAGTALAFVSLGRSEPSADPAVTHDALLRALAGDGRVVALDAAPAQNANAVVVTRQTADRYGLEAISDLRGLDDELTFGGPPECPSRPFCILGLDAVYGLRFSDFLAVGAGGRTTVDALEASHVDVALMFTTDPMLDSGELVVLDDDRHLQPADNVTPLINAAALERFGPRLAEVLDLVSGRLTTDDLRELNGEVDRGASPAEAAAAWLESEGLT